MTPAQIVRVDASWRAACRRRSELQTAITLNMPPGTKKVEVRAEWIMQTVDRLVPLLASPTQLPPAAKEMVARRGKVTSADLIAARDALLAGLSHVLGDLSPPTLVAWHQACGLFADVIAALIVNPFAR
jgi:hypothetical protein